MTPAGACAQAFPIPNLPSRAAPSLSPKTASLFTSSLHLLYQLLPSPDPPSPFHHPACFCFHPPDPLAPRSESSAVARRRQQNPKRAAAMPSPPAFLSLILLTLLLSTAAAANDGSQAGGPVRRRDDLVPVAPAAELGAMALGVMNETTRRRLRGSFQICAPCTCCGGTRGACVLSPCCYSINCNIPNRPFGYCSFTPKSCDCLGCNL